MGFYISGAKNKTHALKRARQKAPKSQTVTSIGKTRTGFYAYTKTKKRFG